MHSGSVLRFFAHSELLALLFLNVEIIILLFKTTVSIAEALLRCSEFVDDTTTVY